MLCLSIGTFAAAICLLSFFFIRRQDFFIWWRRNPESKMPLILYHGPESCKSLLNTGRNGDVLMPRLEDLLLARALPNVRLHKAFGIDNAFTTVNTTRYIAFLNDSKHLLRIQSWTRIRDAAKIAISIAKSSQTGHEADPAGIPLASLVGTVVLMVILSVFFNAVIEELDESLTRKIAEEINALWLLSKAKSCKRECLEKDQEVLRAHLEEILFESHASHDSEFARENPLNIILPAYETLWRVVLRCFIEVRFRDPEVRGRAKTVFDKFLATPTRTQLESSVHHHHSGGYTTSAKWMTSEALRLYPPTRHIHRYVSASTSDHPEPHIGAADIASLHRNKTFWGENANKFDESRWNDITGEADYYMPFGYDRFTCPAKSSFAPMMIAVLVASLLDGFGEGWILEGDVGGNEPLDLDRNSLRELSVKKERGFSF
ncbi:hypothetical protein MMC14_009829 [Varicellaria rhodocarpa]|nr:hypothetical protein [Varicellaria rhodocarpa]